MNQSNHNNNGTSPEHNAVSWLPGTAKQQGGWAVVLGAGIWGLFWLPLRYLDDQGITGLWAIALVTFFGILPPLVKLVSDKNLHTLKVTDNWFVGIAFALSVVLYFTGVIFSDVIRVIFLFYLLPVWTTLAARILYKEPVPFPRQLAIALALVGVWLLLGEGSGIPIPDNIGDWCGLLSGACWGISLVFIKGKDNVETNTVILITSISSTVIASSVALLLLAIGLNSPTTMPEGSTLLLALVVSVGFSVLFLYPALFGQMWGTQRVGAPTAALLTMTEIIVATISAYLVIGTALSGISLVGALIILVAVLIDVIYGMRTEPSS